MKLENTWKITLDKFTQYIEADNMDSAIIKAHNTFHSRLNGVGFKDLHKLTKECQKACKLTKLTGSYRFGFINGWTTIHCNNDKSIYEAYNEALQHEFCDNKTITEIYKAR